MLNDGVNTIDLVNNNLVDHNLVDSNNLVDGTMSDNV